MRGFILPIVSVVLAIAVLDHCQMVDGRAMAHIIYAMGEHLVEKMF